MSSSTLSVAYSLFIYQHEIQSYAKETAAPFCGKGNLEETRQILIPHLSVSFLQKMEVTFFCCHINGVQYEVNKSYIQKIQE